MKRFPCFIVCLCLILISGCTRKNETSSGESASAAPETVLTPAGTSAEPVSAGGKPETIKPERTLSLNVENTLREGGRKITAEGQVSVPAEAGFVDKATFLARISAEVMPEDMEIGPLQNQAEGENPLFPQLVRRVNDFFNAYTADKGWKSMLLPEIRIMLETALGGFNAKPGTSIVSYRLGTMTVRDDVCICNVRLFSTTGRAGGELYLEKSDETWYISDIQVDIAELQKPYTGKGKFEPSLYRWLEIP